MEEITAKTGGLPKGQAAEYYVAYITSVQGYPAQLVPQNSIFDLYMEGRHQDWLKVQVKTTSSRGWKNTRKDSWVWNLLTGASKVKKYNFAQIDLFAFMVWQTEEVAFVPSKSIITTSKFTLKDHEIEKYSLGKALDLFYSD